MPATPLDAPAWDGDLYRRPRGLVAGDGKLDPQQLATTIATLTARLSRIAWTAIAAALAILAIFGLGWASRLAATRNATGSPTPTPCRR